MQTIFDFMGELPKRLRRPERLFFGILPDAACAVRAGGLREHLFAAYRLRGAPVENNRLHVSLHRVGDYWRLREKEIYPARQAAAATSMHSFDVTFRIIHSFASVHRGAIPKRPLVLVAESDGLLKLHERLGRAMQKVGLKATLQPGTPHMTLFYGTKAVPTQPMAPLRFTVGEFVLIHSERGLTRYNVIGRWPLQP